MDREIEINGESQDQQERMTQVQSWEWSKKKVLRQRDTKARKDGEQQWGHCRREGKGRYSESGFHEKF